MQGDQTLPLEVDSGAYAAARDAIMPLSEMVKSPEHVHTYRITPLSLWNAASAGHTTRDALERFSRYPIPDKARFLIADNIARYGRLRLVAGAGDALLLASHDKDLLELIERQREIAPYLPPGRDEEGRLRVDTTSRGLVKKALMKAGWPVEDHAGYVPGAPLALALRARSGRRRALCLAPLEDHAQRRRFLPVTQGYRYTTRPPGGDVVRRRARGGGGAGEPGLHCGRSCERTRSARPLSGCGRTMGGMGMAADGAAAATYTSRLGIKYELRRIVTARGVRYVAARNEVGEAISAMPEGYEFAENVHGQVSVRRVRPSPFRPGELEAVRALLASRPNTRAYRAEPVGRAIVVYHPMRRWFGPGDGEELDEETATVVEAMRRAFESLEPGRRQETIASLIRDHKPHAVLGAIQTLSLASLRAQVESLPTQYAEIVRLRLTAPAPRRFSLERCYFSGEGGWHWLKDGPDPAALLRTVLKDLGPDGPKESLFERF